MKIGILTMHRVINYGSVLQAYALRNILENMGCTCEFLDIIPGESVGSNQDKLQNYYIKLKNILEIGIKNKFDSVVYQKKRKAVITNFLINFLNCQEQNFNGSLYDAVFIGSDEVFNVLQNSSWGLSTQLLGSIENPHVFSYAASFGNTTLLMIREKHVENTMIDALNNITHISVRDNNSETIISELLHRKPQKHIDPTLVYSFEKEIVHQRYSEKYILVYGYNNRLHDKNFIVSLKKFANKKNLKLVSVGNFQYWCDEQIAVLPFELLGWFNDAEYIVTDTFHGTVFSIKYHKQFITIIRESNKQKLSDLLSTFKLQDRAVKETGNFTNVLTTPVDYSAYDSIVTLEREKSIEYLKKCLEEI